MTVGSKESAIRTKGGFPFISFLIPNIIVPPSNIKCREVSGFFELVEEF